MGQGDTSILPSGARARCSGVMRGTRTTPVSSGSRSLTSPHWHARFRRSPAPSAGPCFHFEDSEGELADISDFSIVTYERKPGCWRAAITQRDGAGMIVGKDMRSVVTPDDYPTELDAELAARKQIKNL